MELSTKETKLGYVYDADRNELIKSYKFRRKKSLLASDWYTFQKHACRVFVGLNVTSFQSALYKYSNLVFFGVPKIYIFFIMK